MARTSPPTDSLRGWVSALVAGALAAVLITVVTRTTGVRAEGVAATLVSSFVFVYPVFALVYVGWGAWVYTRLEPGRLREVAATEARKARRRWRRAFALSAGSMNDTISAAVIAVLVTVGISQIPAFRAETVYLVGGLLTVAAAWALMVFSFAQSYLRLDAVADDRPIRFPFPDEPRFGDYVTLALLVSTMAATVSAEFTTRRAWRQVRTNVVVAFAFNTVIIAMTVSLLFGSISG